MGNRGRRRRKRANSSLQISRKSIIRHRRRPARATIRTEGARNNRNTGRHERRNNRRHSLRHRPRKVRGRLILRRVLMPVGDGTLPLRAIFKVIRKVSS